ncbi:lysylphosphatidylglycerol synthase transmembrane domain-containing protein [Capillimicrobium parvum]|uniref:Flippase-like domain-containing protein n=1 Tax=Capillimicrobium parvum TaxID=2884022 RepID=A0A9E6Y117_9ACTN|nr:lysylphosphatidylglycerol synthase transmembrane domain-containing protein [Capillimicrobium parvum]UGS37642.1 hypothetical protein DSM104329_04062 [Capillimicrobium parvum]
MSDDVRLEEARKHALRPWSAESIAELEREALNDEEMPRVQFSGKALALGVLFILSIVAFLYFVLPQIEGLNDTWHRIEQGSPWWLGVAAVFTVLSFGGYVLLFHGIFAPGAPRQLTAAEAYQVTMAALAATRLFAAAGAGGLALQAWAMRRSGMSRKMVADRTITFLVLQYAVYMACMVIFGVGLYVGLFSGPAPFAITVVPAIFAAVAIAISLLLALTPTDLQRRLEGFARHGGRLARLAQKLATVPATMSQGVRDAIKHVRGRDPSLAGAVAYWGFNIAVLWASFRAFGDSPSLAVLVMSYFVGMLGNLLPLPGGVGGVDGGMIGACIAFGVPSSLAVVAVLTYRAFAFWLPTLPGIVAYFQLRRTVNRWRAEPLPQTTTG